MRPGEGVSNYDWAVIAVLTRPKKITASNLFLATTAAGRKRGSTEFVRLFEKLHCQPTSTANPSDFSDTISPTCPASSQGARRHARRRIGHCRRRLVSAPADSGGIGGLRTVRAARSQLYGYDLTRHMI